MQIPIKLPVLTSVLLLGLTACESAARFGDDAIRTASFNRVQTTLLEDKFATEDCEAFLTQSFGFPKRSLDVKNGVQITQAYACKGDTIIATASLINRNQYPMYCAAFTESAEIGTWVGPKGVASFDYDFVLATSYDCFS